MAGGWTNDNSVNDQIDATVADDIKRAQTKLAGSGPAATHCDECGARIPEARSPGSQDARRMPGEANKAEAAFSGYYRCGSKDSQLC